MCSWQLMWFCSFSSARESCAERYSMDFCENNLAVQFFFKLSLKVNPLKSAGAIWKTFKQVLSIWTLISALGQNEVTGMVQGVTAYDLNNYNLCLVSECSSWSCVTGRSISDNLDYLKTLIDILDIPESANIFFPCAVEYKIGRCNGKESTAPG